MSPAPDHSYLIQLAGKLLFKVATRDNVHLAPTWLSRAAAKRLKSGLCQLEAFLRRMLLVMALTLEPTLKPSAPLYAPKSPKKSRNVPSKGAFRLNLSPTLPPPDHLRDLPRKPRLNETLVPARPFIDRILTLQDLIEAPEKRARRLAFHLARTRPGLLIAPDLDKDLIPNRTGTELSATYRALALQIVTRSRARPPPLGPVPRAPPRVRALE